MSFYRGVKKMQREQLRKLAEHSISKDSKLCICENYPEEVKDVMYELMVHKIELEMQNDELLNARTELEISKSKYKKLFQLAPISYVAFDKSGKVTEWNNCFQEMFSTIGAYLYDKPFIIFVAQEYQEIFYKHIESVFSSSKEVTCKIKLRDGRKYFWARLTSQKIENDNLTNGEFLCLTTIENIEQQEQLTDRLITAKDEAEKAYMAKNMFLENISHEIRTPLNGIIGINRLLLISNQDDEEAEELLMMQQKAASDLTELLDHVLDYSIIEVGKMEICPAEENLRNMVCEVYRLHQTAAQEKALTLNYSIGKNVPMFAYIDKLRVMQILSSLLSNAIKFTAFGEIELFVMNGLNIGERGTITFEVKDTGIGIPYNLQSKLFREFTQADNSYTKNYKGTGLGLALSMKLANLMKGSIYFTSNEGEGSSFYLNIPLMECKDAVIQESQQEELYFYRKKA